MRTFVIILLLSLFSFSATAQQDPGVDQMRRNGDTLQYAIPVVALGAAIFSYYGSQKDRFGIDSYTGTTFPEPRIYTPNPVSEFSYTFLSSQLVTHALKYSINAKRPDGGGRGFPSGHTSAAFTGAEFIREQYGWTWGLPAYLAASYVGYSRVASDRHFGRDVLAGAALGILANHLGPWNDESGRHHWLPGVRLGGAGDIGVLFEFRW